MPNEHFSNKPINILKASLPFLPGTAQRFISYYIKIEEFNILCNNLNDEIDNDIRACENNNYPNPNDLVNAIKPYLNNSERELVDMFMNMTTALNMYTAYKSLPNMYNSKPNTDVNVNEKKYNSEMSHNIENNSAFVNTADSNNDSVDNSINYNNINNNADSNFNDSLNNNSDDRSNDSSNDSPNSNSNNNFNNINIDMLKNMLSPSQRAMFDTYSSMLNN